MRKVFKNIIATITAMSVTMSMTVPVSAISVNDITVQKISINSDCSIIKNLNIKSILKKFGFSFEQSDTDITQKPETTPITPAKPVTPDVSKPNTTLT